MIARLLGKIEIEKQTAYLIEANNRMHNKPMQKLKHTFKRSFNE